MKLRRLELISIAIFGLLAPHALLAQSVGQSYIETIDVKVLNAELVAVGRVISVSGKPRAVDALIDVGEKLKGDTPDPHNLHVTEYSDSKDLTNLLKSNKTARLLLIGNGFTSLDSKDLSVPTASGVLLHDPDKVIEYVREVLRTHPGVNRVATFPVPRPKDWKTETSRANFCSNPGGNCLLVPADANLEKWAVETIRDRPPGSDYSRAFEAMRKFFKSDQNIALIKSQLDDPTYLSRFAEYNNGIEVRTYEIRRWAFESLKAWGVDVPQPVIQEEFPKFNTVEKLFWTGRLTDADIEKLLGAPALKTLSFNAAISDEQIARIGHIATLTQLTIPGITDSGLANLGQLPNLQELDISFSAVSDKGLAALSPLPNLKRIILSVTRISDESLEILARFPKLESVNLTLTRTTKEAIAQSRRAHPNLMIELSNDTYRIRVETLALAAFNGDTKAARKSLEMGWDPNRRDASRNTAIYYAVSQNQYEMVKLLLDHKARVDILDSGDDTPLVWASRYGYVRIMRLLLDRGANVNNVDSEWNTPLHFAAQNGTEDTIRLLLASNALASARNREGLTPLDVARKYRNSAAESELLKFSAESQTLK